MTALLNIDQARELIAAVVLDANDIREGWRSESYSSVLERAHEIAGVKHAKPISERRAKSVLTRAHKAASVIGFYSDPIQQAAAVSAVLAAAARAAK